MYTDELYGRPPLPHSLAKLVHSWERAYPCYVRAAAGANVAISVPTEETKKHSSSSSSASGTTSGGGSHGGGKSSHHGSGEPEGESLLVPQPSTTRRKSMSRHSSAHDMHKSQAAAMAAAFSKAAATYASPPNKSTLVLPAIPAVHVPVVREVSVRTESAVNPLPHPLGLFLDAGITPGSSLTDPDKLLVSVASHLAGPNAGPGLTNILNQSLSGAGQAAVRDAAATATSSRKHHHHHSRQESQDSLHSKRSSRRKSTTSTHKRRISGQHAGPSGPAAAAAAAALTAANTGGGSNMGAASDPDNPASILADLWISHNTEGVALGYPSGQPSSISKLTKFPRKVREERVVDARDFYGLALPSVSEETIQTLAWVLRLLHIRRKTMRSVDFLWENLYPQVNGVPVYNPAGKYVLKVYIGGTAYALEFDDQLPVSASGEVLLPKSVHKAEIWPWLIGKALLVLQARLGSVHSPTEVDKAAPRTLSALHRFLRKEPSGSATPWLVSHLTAWIPTTIQIPHPTHASELAGERVWEAIEDAIAHSALTVAETHVAGSKHVYVCLQARVHPVYGRQLLLDTATPPKATAPPTAPVAPVTTTPKPILTNAQPSGARESGSSLLGARPTVHRRPTLMDMANVKRSEAFTNQSLASPSSSSTSSTASSSGSQSEYFSSYEDDSDNTASSVGLLDADAGAEVDGVRSDDESDKEESFRSSESTSPTPPSRVAATMAPPEKQMRRSVSFADDHQQPLLSTSPSGMTSPHPPSTTTTTTPTQALPLAPPPVTETVDAPVRLSSAFRHPNRVPQKTPEWVSYLDFMELFSVLFVFRDPRTYSSRLSSVVAIPKKDVLYPPTPAAHPNQFGDLWYGRHASAVNAAHVIAVQSPLKAYQLSYVGGKGANLSLPSYGTVSPPTAAADTQGSSGGSGSRHHTRDRSKKKHRRGSGDDNNNNHHHHHHHHHHSSSSNAASNNNSNSSNATSNNNNNNNNNNTPSSNAAGGGSGSLPLKSSKLSASGLDLNATSESILGMVGSSSSLDGNNSSNISAINPFVVCGKVKSSMLLHVIVSSASAVGSERRTETKDRGTESGNGEKEGEEDEEGERGGEEKSERKKKRKKEGPGGEGGSEGEEGGEGGGKTRRSRSRRDLGVVGQGQGGEVDPEKLPPPNELCIVMAARGSNTVSSSVVLNGFNWRDRGSRPTLALVEVPPGEIGSRSVHLRPGSHTFTIHVNGEVGDALLFLGGSRVKVFVAPRKKILETFLGVHVQEFGGRIPAAPDKAWAVWFKFNMRVSQQLHMSAQLSVESAAAAQYAQLSIIDHSRGEMMTTPLLHTTLARVYKPVAATGADALYTIQADCLQNSMSALAGSRWRLRLLSDKPFVPSLEETHQVVERGSYQKEGRAWRSGVLFRLVLTLKDEDSIPSVALSLKTSERTARIRLEVLAVETSARGTQESEIDAQSRSLDGKDGFGTVVLPYVRIPREKEEGKEEEEGEGGGIKVVVIGRVDDESWTGVVDLESSTAAVTVANLTALAAATTTTEEDESGAEGVGELVSSVSGLMVSDGDPEVMVGKEVGKEVGEAAGKEAGKEMDISSSSRGRDRESKGERGERSRSRRRSKREKPPRGDRRRTRGESSRDKSFGDRSGLKSSELDDSVTGLGAPQLGWTLSVYSESPVVLREDTTRADELSRVKAGWEIDEPGRSVRAEKIRSVWMAGGVPSVGGGGGGGGGGGSSGGGEEGGSGGGKEKGRLSRSGSRTNARKSRKKRGGGSSASLDVEKGESHPTITQELAKERSEPVVWGREDDVVEEEMTGAEYESARGREFRMRNREREMRNARKERFIHDFESLGSRVHRYRTRDNRLRTEFMKRKAAEAEAAEEAKRAALAAAAEEEKARREEDDRRRGHGGSKHLNRSSAGDRDGRGGGGGGGGGKGKGKGGRSKHHHRRRER